MISAFHFERPLWLLALLPALLLWLLQHRASDAGERWRRVIDPDLLRHLLVGGQARARITPNGLLLSAWGLVTIAVAGPAWELEPSPFADAKPPVVVVLKVTPSMQAGDLAPTRLDRGRQKLADLLARREGAATGLIAYAGSSHLVLPPTPDTQVVLSMAKALAPQVMPTDGDDLAGAVAEAERILASGRRGGSILVMADVVSGDQIGRIAARPPGTPHPAVILALVPPGQDAPSLAQAARSLDAPLVATTVDQADVAAIASRLDRAETAADVAGEGRHWKEAGYWLTPLLALIAVGWFRRGWVLS
jgi:Ca-activated chloride channel family protein